MNYELVKKENNKATINISVGAEGLEVAIKEAYLKERKHFNLPGFRKGKTPRKMIETQYGDGVFYEEAINILLNEHYPKAIEELGLKIVDRPDVDIKEISKETGAVLEATVDVEPEFTIENYKGFEVEKIENEITDEKVQEELTRIQDQNGRNITLEEGKVELNDTANIDFKGFLGEEQFEGGTGEGHDLTIGSNQFIPGFEEKLIGAEVGTEIDVDVTFPEEYQAEELAGKAVVFKVKVNSIARKELPTLDDEFAKDVSEFDTLEEYKTDLKNIMIEQAANADKSAQRDKIIEVASELVDFDIPQGMINSEVDNMIREFDMQLQSQGLGMDQYYEMTGSTSDAFREQLSEDAKSRVKTGLVVDKIKELEDIQATEEELEAELQKYADAQKVELEEIKKMFAGDNFEYIKNSISTKKTVDFLVDNAKLK